MPSRMATAKMLITSSAWGPSRWAPSTRSVSSATSTLKPEVVSPTRRVLVVEVRHPTRAVDGHVGLEPPLDTRLTGPHDEAVGGGIDGGHLGADLERDAELATALHEQRDEVGIEGLQRPGAPMHDGDPSAGVGGDVRELEGDVA